jgi:ABC-type branched-subunit amino acid transport system substrate-binding protein
MKRTPISRGILSTLLTVWLSFAGSIVHAAEDTIRVGILHSLSGTMAISESVLKDTVLMLIADQNKKGGLLGRKLEPVVVDPASDWGTFAEKASDLLVKEKVAVVFGCWTSLSRKAVLPIFEQHNGLLYYPVQYEGEESSRNIFYLGAAVISTVTGDSNAPLYAELIKQRIDASKMPFMALSVSERELRSVDIGKLAGHMAARSYFQSVKSAENDAFIKMWADFNQEQDSTTNDAMESTFIGFRMWAQAVTQARTADVNAVRQAMYGQRVRAPSGFEVVMNTNHHLSKPAMIGKLDASGTYDVVWRSISPIKASVWSRYLPESAKRTADWTFPWVCGGCTEPTYKDWR